MDLSPRPARGELDSPLELLAGRFSRKAHVETHGDVRAEPQLDLSDALGREPLRRAVVDRPKRDAVVVEADDRVAEREDLEAAGVREHRALPAGERVDPAQALDELLARAEVEVVGVPEDHGRAERAHLV